MLNEIKIFEKEEFGKIRTVVKNNEIWFVGKDVAEVLGYSAPSKAIIDHCKGITKMVIPSERGGNQETNIIPERDLYRLIMKSKLPQAEKFEEWVVSEVLPTIRKTGGYVASSEKFVESYFSSLDENTKKFLTITLDDKLRVEAELKEAKNKIEEQQPLVSFAESVSKSTDSIDIGEFSKLIKDEDINLGRNKMFEWLRENKFLMDNNVPYQKYINNKYFEIIEVAKGNKLYIKTLILPVAQIKIIEKLKKEFCNNINY